MTQINLDIIKKFKEIFFYERDFESSDIKKFFNKEMISNTKNIKWLYWSNEQTYGLIGTDNNLVSAIQDEGELTDVCEGLENIPYEFLRILSFYHTKNLLDDGSIQIKNLLLQIQEYEVWCAENKIELDKNKIYHNENGKLFTHYFERKDFL